MDGEEDLVIGAGDGTGEGAGEGVGPTGEGMSPEEGENTPGSPTGKKNGIQDRFNQLTSQRNIAQSEAAYWRGVAEGLSKAGVPNAGGQSSPTPKDKYPELNPEDFNSDAEYVRAVAEQERQRIRDDFEAERNRGKQSESEKVIVSQYTAGRTKYPDFDSVALNQSVPVTQSMFDAAVGDHLADVLYHLGSNPEEARRISSLNPVQQAKEIGIIEAKIKSPTKTKTATTAPDPPTKVGGHSRTTPKTAGEKTRAELHAEWEAQRRAKLGIK